MVTQNYTVDEVAQIFKMSPQTIRKLIREGRINAFKLGLRSYRISEDEFDRLKVIGYEKNMQALKEAFKNERLT